MNDYYAVIRSDSYLAHHGVKGMKWGVRHDDRSLSDKWRSSISKKYNKNNAKVEARRRRSENENWLRDTKYGKKVNELNNRRYDKEIASNNAERDRALKQVASIIGVGNRIKENKQAKVRARYNSSDYAKAKKMSNQELQIATNRINLEQNYLNALSRDRTSFKEAKSSYIGKIGRRTIDALERKVLNVGVSSIDIGSQLARNAAINTANKYAPITKKPKK